MFVYMMHKPYKLSVFLIFSANLPISVSLMVFVCQPYCLHLSALWSSSVSLMIFVCQPYGLRLSALWSSWSSSVSLMVFVCQSFIEGGSHTYPYNYSNYDTSTELQEVKAQRLQCHSYLRKNASYGYLFIKSLSR